jgi:hypothetical protein
MYHANTYCTTFFVFLHFFLYIAKQENKVVRSKQLTKKLALFNVPLTDFKERTHDP